MRFLSPEWVDALAEAASQAPPPQPELHLTIQQVVTLDEGPDVAWHVSLGPDGVAVRPGRAPSATVTFTQDAETARAIHCGEQSAQGAIMTGRLRVGGDVRVLLERQAQLSQLDDVFADVRTATTY